MVCSFYHFLYHLSTFEPEYSLLHAVDLMQNTIPRYKVKNKNYQTHSQLSDKGLLIYNDTNG
jgi:hypothetical protein